MKRWGRRTPVPARNLVCILSATLVCYSHVLHIPSLTYLLNASCTLYLALDGSCVDCCSAEAVGTGLKPDTAYRRSSLVEACSSFKGIARPGFVSRKIAKKIDWTLRRRVTHVVPTSYSDESDEAKDPNVTRKLLLTNSDYFLDLNLPTPSGSYPHFHRSYYPYRLERPHL